MLSAIADETKAGLRSYDIAARFGGEEFVLVLPGTSLARGIELAESLRQRVGAISFLPPLENLKVTISLGVAFLPLPQHNDMDSLIEQADEALFRAKQNGSNRVETMSVPL